MPTSTVAPEARLGAAWQKYLEAGAAYWSSHEAPAFPSDIQLQAINGQLIDTPFLNYLLYRRQLNPARFDLYHPAVGPALGALSPPLSISVSPPPATPTNPPTPTNPQGQDIQVPEPSMGAIALLSVAAGVVWGLRARRPVS